MATVRITHSIRSFAKAKLRDMFEARIKQAESELEKLPLADAAYERHYGHSILNQIERFIQASPNVHWFPMENGAMVRFSVGGVGDEDDCQYTVRSTFRVPRARPYGRSYYEAYTLPKDDPIYPAAVEAVRNIEAIKNEQKKLIQSLIDGVLTQCTTLRQVLELWPTALEFMPEEVRIKHAEPTVKRTPATKPDEVDVSVKAALMTARMLSNVGAK